MSDPRNQENQPMSFFSEVEELANSDDVDLRAMTERDSITADTMPAPDPFARVDASDEPDTGDER